MSITDFALHLSEKWGIDSKIANRVCEHFDEKDSVYYIDDYDPVVSSEVDISTLHVLYGELNRISALAPKRKKVMTALKKADALDGEITSQIQYCTNSEELDDILIPYRSNVRSKGQIAIKKGLEELADTVDEQELEDGTFEDLAEKFVGKDATLKTVEDVTEGVKNILAERYAHEDTARAMVRDIGFDYGFFEIIPKDKKDKKFITYRGREISVSEITSEEYLMLKKAEHDKKIKIRFGVQLFQITELLRHHFIENPDAVGFEVICDAIDDSWSRLLQPIVEKSVRNKIDEKADFWALAKIDSELDALLKEHKFSGTMIVVGQFSEKKMIVAALNSNGRLLGITTEKLHGTGKAFTSNRIRQFHNRFRITKAIILKNKFSEIATSIVEKSLEEVAGGVPVEVFSLDRAHSLVNSSWMKESNSDLEDEMRIIYSLGLTYILPISVILKAGLKYFRIHELQNVVNEESLSALLKHRYISDQLHHGISPADAPDSILKELSCVDEPALMAIRKAFADGKISKKSDIRKIEKVDEIVFRNIAGYLVIPGAQNPLDVTMIHPEYFGWVEAIATDIGSDVAKIIATPDLVSSAELTDPTESIYLQKKIPMQLKVAANFRKGTAPTGKKSFRRVRLSELKEGDVLPGKVTNITNFGVFIDINSNSDGLVHISELADGYIESAEQVVTLGQAVDVRVLSVDFKKRRVSLSMKNLGNKAPKIKPSQGQLSNLADHFKTH